MRLGPALAVTFAALLVAACVRQPPAQVVYKAPGTGAQPAPAEQTKRTVTARSGDTLYAIARRHGVPVRALIDANGLKPPYRLRVGQELVLPRPREHVVARGETLYGISRRYRVGMSVLARANGLREPYRLVVGQRLRLPATASKEPAVGVALGSVDGQPPPAPPPKPVSAAAAAPPASGPLSAPPPRAARMFLWPVRGKVVARFGAKPGGLHNDGINIQAPRGSAVRAAENGVVAYTGNELRGYGNLVLIRHADGWISAYAHNDALLVSRGETVRRGQLIARVGSTGNVATPQSHFELRRGARSVDPLKHLVKN